MQQRINYSNEKKVNKFTPKLPANKIGAPPDMEEKHGNRGLIYSKWCNKYSPIKTSSNNIGTLRKAEEKYGNRGLITAMKKVTLPIKLPATISKYEKRRKILPPAHSPWEAFLNPEECLQTACHFPFRASKENYHIQRYESSQQQQLLFTGTSSQCSSNNPTRSR
ncbi:hypothetical protein AVEN_166019-1 [Araneus ventricosus]|uniref:Uncharacterized protein n=1 Tax=Araneus ventricosus TaxID=182803 RepID=A0A4Y2L6W0_ARAVE|nr:hypothetical protein AVEN_166019-1 [Araneus ventricosus]